jgi:replicative DNA helicase
LAEQLAARARNPLESAEDVVADFLRVPDQIGSQGGLLSERLGVPLGRSMETVEATVANPQGIQGVPTGLYDLDDTLDGWQNGELVLVAGRPSMGKTAIGLHFIRRAAESVPVLLVSAEMRAQAIALRMIALESRLDSHALRRGRVTLDQLQMARVGKDTLAALPIYLADRIFDVRTLVLEARKARREHGVGLVVVDYLQLLRPAERSDSREREVASIGRALKGMAVELDVPVIAMTQLSRAVESRAGHKPQMSDLRESGSLEQDADVVILLYRPAAYADAESAGAPGQPKDVSHLLELIIAKHRNGRIGTIQAYYELESGFIAPLAESGY